MFITVKILHFFPNLVEGKLLHSLCHNQHESAVGIHMSPSFLISLPFLPTSRLLQSPCLSSLSNTANFHWLSILHMVVYMLPCYSIHPTLFFFPPAHVRKSVLCLHCCPVNRFIRIIFLDSIYVC